MGVILSLRRDAVWTAADTFITSGLAFAFRLLVAKLLAPGQFGLVAMVLAVVALLQVINEFGFTSALIQKAEARLTPALINTTFTASLLVSIAAAATLAWVIAPLAARYYDQPAAGPLLRALSPMLLAAPFNTVAAALLYRQRRYRDLAINRAVSTLASIAIAGVVLVLQADAWVVVWQVLIATALSTIGLVILAKWRFRLMLEPAHLREVLGFSGFVLASDVVGQLNANLGVFVIGRFLSVSEVGLFGLAIYFTDTARRMVMSILNRVTFVHYSSLQDDKDALRQTYFSTVTWNCRLLFPVMIAMMTFGPGLLIDFLGNAWQPMAPVVAILSLSIIIQTAGGMTSTLFKAVGRPDVETAVIVATSFFVLAPLVVVGALTGGLVGVAIGTAVAKLIAVVVRQFLMERIVGGTVPTMLRIVGRLLIRQLPIVAAWGIVLMIGPHHWYVDIALLALGIAAYALWEMPHEVSNAFKRAIRLVRDIRRPPVAEKQS